MNIRINGTNLNGVPYAELERKFSLIGSDEIEQSMSVDFDIPRTPDNETLTGIVAGRYDPVQPCRTSLACIITTDVFSLPAELYVNYWDDTVINVTVYVGIPGIDTPLREVILNRTGGDIVMRLDDAIVLSTVLYPYGYYQYMCDGNIPNPMQRMPNPYVRVDTITDAIREVTGLDYVGNYGDHAVVPTSYYISPQRDVQWLYCANNGAAYNYFEHYGNHICSDFNTTNRMVLTINRDCTAELHMWAGLNNSGDYYGVKLYMIRNGAPSLLLAISDAGVNDYCTGDATVALKSGDKLYIKKDAACDGVILGIKYTNYLVTDADWEAKEIINDRTIPRIGPNLYQPMIDGVYATLSVYSVAANMGDVTVGQFLRGIASAKGGEVVFNGLQYDISTVTPVAITTFGGRKYAPVSTAIGQSNTLEWGGEQQTLQLDSPRLSDSVEVWAKNPFWVAGHMMGSFDFCDIPNVDSNNKTVKMERRLALASKPIEPGYLSHFYRTNVPTLAYIDKCLEVTFTTYDLSVYKSHYVVIDMQVYAITSLTYDEESGIIEATALLLNQEI